MSLYRSSFSTQDLNIGSWRIYAGKYNISTTGPYEKYYRISRVVVHPGFNYTNLAYDVAILTTTSPIR